MHLAVKTHLKATGMQLAEGSTATACAAEQRFMVQMVSFWNRPVHTFQHLELR